MGAQPHSYQSYVKIPLNRLIPHLGKGVAEEHTGVRPFYLTYFYKYNDGFPRNRQGTVSIDDRAVTNLRLVDDVSGLGGN